MKVFISCPTYDRPQWETTGSVWGCIIALMLKKYEVHFDYQVSHGDPLLSRQRSLEAGRFLDTDCEVLVCVDSDMVIKPQTIEQLCASPHDIVGVPVRAGDRWNMWPHDITTGVVNVRAIGTGIMAVKRHVLTGMSEAYPELRFTLKGQTGWGFYMPFITEAFSNSNEPIYLPEDFAFCERARAAGYKVHADFTLQASHVKMLSI